MFALLTTLLAATAMALPAQVERGERGHHRPPTPTLTFGPPPSNLPTSSPGVPYTSTSVWMPPQPTDWPHHYGDMESTPVWLHYPGGAPLYNMCLEAKGCGRGRKGRNGKVFM